MAEKIYIRNASGELEPLTEERFETEDLLQELIGQHPELLAVEVKQYPGQFGQALVSRVIGQIEPLRDAASGTTAGRRRRMSVDEFLGAFGADVQPAAAKLINDAQKAGANITGSPGGIRIGGRSPVYRNPN